MFNITEDSARNWLRNHAIKEKCPPCAGRKRPNKLWDSLAQSPCICPECKKIWIYKVNMRQEVKKRVPSWHYAKHQMSGII